MTEYLDKQKVLDAFYLYDDSWVRKMVKSGDFDVTPPTPTPQTVTLGDGTVAKVGDRVSFNGGAFAAWIDDLYTNGEETVAPSTHWHRARSTS